MGARALFGGAVMRILRINYRPDFDDLIFQMSEMEESVTTWVSLVNFVEFSLYELNGIIGQLHLHLDITLGRRKL